MIAGIAGLCIVLYLCNFPPVYKGLRMAAFAGWGFFSIAVPLWVLYDDVKHGDIGTALVTVPVACLMAVPFFYVCLKLKTRHDETVGE